jgi:hypothetical protein
VEGLSQVAGRIPGVISRLIERITSRIDNVLLSQGHIFAVSRDILDRNLFLNGQIAARQLRDANRIDTLADAEFRVTSQFGEDGIIEWIVQRIPGIHRSFIEFGVENYGEANTRFLLRNRGWRGLIMDGTAANMNHVRTETIHWMHDLVAVEAFITAENINDLIKTNGFDGELGILSVDIDGNDYWVLKAIDCVNPAVIIAEVNGVLGDLHPITVPYDPAFERLKKHHSGQYFGASVKAMQHICAQKGYTFLGTNSAGVNAFFVRDDLAAPLVAQIGEIRSWPARHRDSRDAEGRLTYTRGRNKAKLVEHLPVVDVTNGETRKLSECGELYSPQWLRDL